MRKKILWLCSWYPSDTEPFSGDFIQRHAKAASLYNDIAVIHVVESPAGENFAETTENFSEGLSEKIVYYKKNRSFAGKFINHFRWLSLFKKAIRNYIVKNGKPDLVHVHVPFKAGLLGLWLLKKYKVRFIITEHWGIYNDIIENKYADKSRTFKYYTRKITEAADGYISVSRYLANGVNRLVAKKDFLVIPNSVDTDLFFYKEKAPAKFRFLHVSNMVPLKNVKGILNSFKKFLTGNMDAQLVLVGSADSEIRSYADQQEFPKDVIRFTGEVSYEEVAIEMQLADCLVLFSIIENSPCVIGEALCCGLPVITTNVGGIPELVNSENSIVINTNDEEALSNAMQHMLLRKTNYDHQKIAREAKEKFSFPVIGKMMDSYYNTVISGNTSKTVSL